MPDFTVDGDPGAVRGRAAVLRSKGSTFVSVGDALSRITTDGWTGRAADRFRDKHDAEPERWRRAGDGFVRAAAGLEAYASALETAKARAAWAQQEHARGEQVTRDARAAYDADVSRARGEASDAAARGVFLTLTIHPFSDPGEAIRAGALRELADARADLETAAHSCAREVRAGCADAPSKRNWMESGLASVGSFLAGAGGAVWDLGEMVWNLSPQGQLLHALTSGLTPEELAAQHRITVEQAGALLQAAKDDPVAFGKQLGSALIDLDTWKDDPARALGALVPDLVATVLSGGAGAGARALRSLDGLHDVAALGRPLHGLRSLQGVDALDLAGLGRLDDAALVRRLEGMSPEDQARLLRRGDDWHPASMSDVFGPHRYDADYSRPDVAGSWATGPRVDAPLVPHDGPLVNVHGRGDAGSGTYWTDPAEALRMRDEQQALDRLALRDEWYMDERPDGTTTYAPRDEITLRRFQGGEEQRMQIGTLGPQDRVDGPRWVDDHPGSAGRPEVRPDGTPIPETRPGGATQYVAGLDRPAYDSVVGTWTGPPPWAPAVPDGAWRGFGTGVGVGITTSTAAGAAAEEHGR